MIHLSWTLTVSSFRLWPSRSVSSKKSTRLKHCFSLSPQDLNFDETGFEIFRVRDNGGFERTNTIKKKSGIIVECAAKEYSVNDGNAERQELKFDIPSIIFVYLNDDKTRAYNFVKKLSYNKFGIATQCVTRSKIESAKAGFDQM